MAGISTYLSKIMSAVYGEEVRSSIHDAIVAINAESSSAVEYAQTARDSAAASAREAKASEWNAASLATTAASSATTASQKASEAATSATKAANSATTATQKASAATTSATNAANSATTATQKASAAATSATNAADSATTASQKASAATTSATNAANSATTATQKASAATTSATNAANSATTATQKASAATTSATNAANSATTATQKASAAATSATNAANSATTATQKASAAATSATSAASSANIAKQYSGKPPKPQNGTWWIWDAAKAAYVDSKISCELVGPAGVGVKDIQLTSGDHAPGSTDVYTITLTNGTSCSISVYNGRNGTGAGDVLGVYFDLIIPVSQWVNGKATVTDERLLASAIHKYFISADEASRDEFQECNVRAEDITTNGSITFKSNSNPKKDLTVNVIRLELGVNAT